MGTWLTLAREIFSTVPHGPAAPRDPAHRRRQRGRDARPAAAGGRTSCVGVVPVRLPRRRRPVAGRRGARHRLGAARHRRPHPGAGGDGGRVRGDDARVDGARRRQRPSCACGSRRAPSCSSSSRSRRPSRTSPRGAPQVNPLTGGLPDGRLVRREPRLPRGGTPAGQARSARSSSPPACRSRSVATRSDAGARQGQVEQRRVPDHADRRPRRRATRARPSWPR